MLVKVDPETAEPDQGDTEARPNPAPRASNAKERAAATKAPARMLAQETPDPTSVQTVRSVPMAASMISPPSGNFVLYAGRELRPKAKGSNRGRAEGRLRGTKGRATKLLHRAKIVRWLSYGRFLWHTAHVSLLPQRRIDLLLTATPTVSAMTAPRLPKGFSCSMVESRAV